MDYCLFRAIFRALDPRGAWTYRGRVGFSVAPPNGVTAEQNGEAVEQRHFLSVRRPAVLWYRRDPRRLARLATAAGMGAEWYLQLVEKARKFARIGEPAISASACGVPFDVVLVDPLLAPLFVVRGSRPAAPGTGEIRLFYDGLSHWADIRRQGPRLPLRPYRLAGLRYLPRNLLPLQLTGPRAHAGKRGRREKRPFSQS